MKPSEFNAQIYEEACTWFIDMRAGDVDAAGRRRFDAWARKSPEHLRAYLEVSEVWDDAALVDPKKEISRDDLIADARTSAEIVPFKARTGQRWLAAASRAGRRGANGFSGPWRWALAAGLAALAVAALALLQLSREPTYTTAIGEQRTITLSDGSRVEMNSRTRLAVHFAEHERGIELLEGQAFFQVVKNPERPFVVRTDGVSVRAVGTEFDVYRKADGTVVTVVEGKVAVLALLSATATRAAGTATPPLATETPPAHSDPHLIGETGAVAKLPSGESISYLAAGEQLTVTAQAVAKPAHADIAAATAWTHGSLVFSGSRLADVVSEFNRYNERQLVIRDRALGDIRISGVYASTDPALLVRFLREQPGISVDERGSSIVISAK